MWELRKAVYVIDRVRADTDDVKHQGEYMKKVKSAKWKVESKFKSATGNSAAGRFVPEIGWQSRCMASRAWLLEI